MPQFCPLDRKFQLLFPVAEDMWFRLNGFGCIRDLIPFFIHEIFSPFHKQS